MSKKKKVKRLVRCVKMLVKWLGINNSKFYSNHGPYICSRCHCPDQLHCHHTDFISVAIEEREEAPPP